MTAPETPAPLAPGRVLLWFVTTLSVLTAAVMGPLFATGASADTFNAAVPLLSWAPTLSAVAAHVGSGRRTPFLTWTALRPLRTGRVLRTGALVLALFVAVPALITALTVALGVVDWRPDAQALQLLPLVLPFALVGLLTVTGEEIGWRGALQTTLVRYGLVRASLAIGALWALWHLPLLTGYWLSGDMAGRAVVASAVGLIFAAPLISAARALSASVWPAAWAHALLNTTLVYATSNLTTPTDQLGDGAFWSVQLVTWAVLGGAGALALCAAARTPATTPPAPEDLPAR